MNNHQKNATLFNLPPLRSLRSEGTLPSDGEVIVAKNLPLNKNIQSIQSMFKNTPFSEETEKSSEMLYNELKNKKGMPVLTINSSSIGPLLPSEGSEGSAPCRRIGWQDPVESAEGIDKGEVRIYNNINNIELQIKNRIEDLIRSRSSEVAELDYKNNSLNSLYLTKFLKNQLTQEQSTDLDTSEFKDQSLLPYLNSLTRFNKKLAKHQHVFYQFNKANNKSYNFLFNKTTKLLNLTFLAMGCLMSKPIYKVIHTKNNLEFEHDTALFRSNNFAGRGAATPILRQEGAQGRKMNNQATLEIGI